MKSSSLKNFAIRRSFVLNNICSSNEFSQLRKKKKTSNKEVGDKEYENMGNTLVRLHDLRFHYFFNVRFILDIIYIRHKFRTIDRAVNFI